MLMAFAPLASFAVKPRAALVTAVTPQLDALTAAGFRLRPELYQAVQRLAGERPG
jgi:hypothetical protein